MKGGERGYGHRRCEKDVIEENGILSSSPVCPEFFGGRIVSGLKLMPKKGGKGDEA